MFEGQEQDHRTWSVVVTPPDADAATNIASLDEAKANLGLSDDTYDGQITALIGAAVDMLDGPNGYLARALGVQTIALNASQFPGQGLRWRPLVHCSADIGFPLLCPPVIGVTSVVYTDPNGVAQTLPPFAYRLMGRKLLPTINTFWPTAEHGTVVVTYQAGYAAIGDAAPVYPPQLKPAVLMMVANLFHASTREAGLRSDTAFGVGSQTYDTSATAVQAVSGVVDALLWKLKAPT